MKALVESKLFGDGLLPVDTPVLVGRYNECLVEMGMAPTGLDAFEVDGAGWSPQIAEERDDSHYLTHGDASRYAIIVTPEQERKPVWRPACSFDRALLAHWFESHREAVANLTASTAVWLDLDVPLSRYRSPADLLLIDHVTIRACGGPVADAARAQHALVERLLGEEDAWQSETLREALVESAREHGNLRGRRVIPEENFEIPPVFHARAFGGVFVLRDAGGDNLLVAEDPAIVEAHDGDGEECLMLAVDDPDLLAWLRERGLLELDLDWYRAHPEALEALREMLAVQAVCAAHPDLDYTSLTSAQRRAYLLDLGDDASFVLFELERFGQQIRTAAVRDCPEISDALARLLVYPADELPGPARAVLWQLLVRWQAHDVLRTYIADKNLFFERYRGWPRCRRDWGVRQIAARYRPMMHW